MDVSSQQPSFDRRALLWQLYRFNARLGPDRLIKGIDFSRCFEYLAAYETLLGKTKGCLLDIGSYRTAFPAFMASQGFRVLATDIDTTALQQKAWAKRAGEGSPGQLQITLTDGRRLSIKDSAFDAISAISTIEHIPGTGDIESLAEIGRSVKPGGLVFISVPYEQAYREGRWGPYFQRYYDATSIEERLIEPSGLDLKRRGYLLGNVSRRFYGPLYKLPSKIIRGLGWSHMFFALYFLDRDNASQEDANVAWLLLERSKPSDEQESG